MGQRAGPWQWGLRQQPSRRGDWGTLGLQQWDLGEQSLGQGGYSHTNPHSGSTAVCARSGTDDIDPPQLPSSPVAACAEDPTADDSHPPPPPRAHQAYSCCSINSINWARIMVQSSYYIWAYLQLRPAADGVVHFSIPTGAFGNAMGGFLARMMGLPIGKIVCATNANDIVHRTLTTGDLSMGSNTETVSPAMDIQFAYNLERLLYFASGRDCTQVRRLMTTLEAARGAQLPQPLLASIQEVFVSLSVLDEQTIETMRRIYRETGYCLCPHSAVGVYALEQLEASLPTAPAICVLTAHPAKFNDAVSRAGIPPQTTPAVDELRKLPHKYTWLRAPLPPHNTPEHKKKAWAAAIRQAVVDANPKARL